MYYSHTKFAILLFFFLIRSANFKIAFIVALPEILNLINFPGSTGEYFYFLIINRTIRIQIFLTLLYIHAYAHVSFLNLSLKQKKSIIKANLNFSCFTYLLSCLFYVWETIYTNDISIAYLGNRLILTRMLTFTFLILEFKHPHIFCFEIQNLYSFINMWIKKTPTKQIKKTHQTIHFSVSLFPLKMSLVWYTIFIQPSKTKFGRYSQEEKNNHLLF